MTAETAVPDSDLTIELCRPIESHARQVMDWLKDPLTLAMSFHKGPKTWDEFWPE